MPTQSPGYAATITDAVRQWAELKLTQLYKAAAARAARHRNRAGEPKPSNSMSGIATDGVGAAASTTDYLSGGDSSSVSTTGVTPTSGTAVADTAAAAGTAAAGVGSAGAGSGHVAASMTHEASSTFGIGGTNVQPVKPSALESMAALNDALPSASAPISRSTTFSNPILPPAPPEGEKVTEDPSSCVVS